MNQVWSKADIHIHTSYSDGYHNVDEVLSYIARSTDLKVIAIADHDVIDGVVEARQKAAEYGLEVIMAEEVTTREGHLLALFIEEWLRPGRPAADTIAEIHAQGGLAIAAHPYGRFVSSMGLGGRLQRYCTGEQPVWPLDGLEVFNASLLMPGNTYRAAADAVALNLAACGGSDSHFRTTIGSGHTLFPGETAADLRRAIEQRRTKPAGRPWKATQTLTMGGLLVRNEVQRIRLNQPRIGQLHH